MNRIFAKHIPEEAKALYAAAQSQEAFLSFNVRNARTADSTPTHTRPTSTPQDLRIVDGMDGENISLSKMLEIFAKSK